MAVKKAVFSLSTLASFIAPAPSFSLFEEANENSIDCVSKYPAKYSYFKGNGKRISKGPRVCICLFEADAVKSSWVKFHPDPAGSQMDWVKLSQEQINLLDGWGMFMARAPCRDYSDEGEFAWIRPLGPERGDNLTWVVDDSAFDGHTEQLVVTGYALAAADSHGELKALGYGTVITGAQILRHVEGPLHLAYCTVTYDLGELYI